MPPCSTGLAPPAFTAPCRNQTSDCAHVIASAVPVVFFGKGPRSVIRDRNRRTTLSLELQIWQAVVLLRQRRVAGVARRQDRLAYGPHDRQHRIVPRDADLARRVVQIGALVLDLRNRADDAEAVREAWRDV